MRFAFALLAVCATAASISASGQPMDMATRAKGAGKVVVARVTDLQARFDTNEFGDRIIVSQSWLEVEESLKGSNAAAMPLDLEGGTVGELTLRVSDMPTLRVGDRAVFFLEAATKPSGAHRPHRRGLGVVKLDSSNREVGGVLTLDEIKAAVRAGQ